MLEPNMCVLYEFSPVPSAFMSSDCIDERYSTPLLVPVDADSFDPKFVVCVDESGASVGVGSAFGDARRLAPGLADGGVSEELLPVPRRASWRARLRMTSDFMEIGRAEPCSL